MGGLSLSEPGQSQVPHLRADDDYISSVGALNCRVLNASLFAEPRQRSGKVAVGDMPQSRRRTVMQIAHASKLLHF